MTLVDLNVYTLVSLTTYREDGSTVVTPVWFAEDEGVIYVTSLANTGEVQRILNNANVTIAPCTGKGQILGLTQPARAELLEETDQQWAFDTLLQKYGQRFLDATQQETSAARVYLRITLA